MATYSSRLRLTLPATGEYTNTWGSVVNDGITALVDDSISGTSAITIAGTDYTLTSVNGSTDEARRMFIVATGTPGAARNVICPAVTKLYSITNNTTGGFALTLKTSAGTGISVPNGATMLLKCDGTNVVQAASTFTDVAYTGTLTGGTGVVNLGAGQFYKNASGNVGIGTASPAAKLHADSLGSDEVARFNATNNPLITMHRANVRQLYIQSTGAQISFTTELAIPITFFTSATERMRVDSSGNVVIGATTANRAGANRGLSVEGASTSVVEANVGASRAGFLYADAASTVLGEFRSFPMVFRTSDTERMRLDASGNLLVGVTAPLTSFGGARATFKAPNSTTTGFVAQSQAAGYEAGAFWNADTTGNNTFAVFGTEATYTTRGSISYNRAGGLTAYNTTSDYRAKDIIGPVQNPGAAIDALKVYEGQMKGATESRPMLIAHEAQAVAPYAVTGTKDAADEHGKPVYQQIDTSSLVPLLLAELKSLRARVAALEAA